MNAAQKLKQIPGEFRRQELVQLLQQHGQLSVRECSELLGVSEVTIRNDMAIAEQEGLLRRVWGGATLPQQVRLEGAFSIRLNHQRSAKEKIGQAAAALVVDGDTVVLDASTTAFFIAQQLKERRNLTVITNGLHTALELGAVPTITTIVTGGQLRGDTGSVLGTLGEEMLSKLHASKGFFSARGITAAKGLTESNILEGQLKAMMITHVDEIVAVVDSTKLGVNSLTSFCPISMVRRLITAGDDAEQKAKPFQSLMEVVLA